MQKLLYFLVIAAGAAGLVQLAVAQELSNRADRKITGDYYRPYSASTYYHGAISHAEALDYYGRNYSYVPDETAKVESMCDELDKAATEGKAIAACCLDFSKEVKAAAAENEKLKETLGIAEPVIKSASKK